MSGCSATKYPLLRTGSSAANWSRAPAASPASPVQRARWARAVRVRGCSAPSTRSLYRQQRGELVPGPGRVPRLPGPVGEVGASAQGARVLGAEDPLDDGQQRGELVPGPGRVPRLPGPAGEVARGWPGCRGARRRAPARLHRQQRGELVAGPGRVPRLPGPAGEVGAGGQGVAGARRRGPARRPAAARRTGPGPRPHPPPARSSRRGWRGRSGCRGCSGRDTRSRHGQQRGELVPGPGRIPRLPGPASEVGAGGQGVRVLGAEHPLSTGSSSRRTGRGPRPHPRPPRSSWARSARAARVSGCSGAEHPLVTGSSAANWSRAPAAFPASPVQRARLAAGGQGVRVLGAEAPAPVLQAPFAEGPWRLRSCRYARDRRRSAPYRSLSAVEGRLGMRQQRGEHGPGSAGSSGRLAARPRSPRRRPARHSAASSAGI